MWWWLFLSLLTTFFPTLQVVFRSNIPLATSTSSYSITTTVTQFMSDHFVLAKASTIVDAFKSIYDLLISCGLKPMLMKLDNKASHELQRILNKNNVDFQLLPPAVHLRNAAEHCVRTFKNHFITTIEATHLDLPIHWVGWPAGSKWNDNQYDSSFEMKFKKFRLHPTTWRI